MPAAAQDFEPGRSGRCPPGWSLISAATTAAQSMATRVECCARAPATRCTWRPPSAPASRPCCGAAPPAMGAHRRGHPPPALRGRNPRGPGLAPAVECALPGRPGAAGQWQQRAFAARRPGPGQPVRAADLALPDPAPAARAGFAVDQPFGAGPQAVRLALWCWARRMWRPDGPTAHLASQAPARGWVAAT